MAQRKDRPEQSKKKLGEVLVEAGVISPGQLEETLAIQKKTRRRLGQVMIELGYVDEDELASLLSKQLKIPIIQLDGIDISPRALDIVDGDRAREKLILPVELTGKDLVLAMANPLDWPTIQDLEFSKGVSISVRIASESAVNRAINRHYGAYNEDIDIAYGLAEFSDFDYAKLVSEDGGASLDTITRISESPQINNLVKQIMVDAAKAEATAVHFEPREKAVNVRFRIDGSLRSNATLPIKLLDGVLARLKSMARMDITNRHSPQDATANVAIGGRDTHFRITTLPTEYGESAVITFIQKLKPVVPIAALLLPPKIKKSLVYFINKPQGMLLVTGPDESGKNTVLYSLLSQLAGEAVKIVAIAEDLQYNLPGTLHVRENEAVGLTPVVMLRSVLRHDPDVIMIGELKDSEVAGVASDAAMGRNLIFCSMQTTDAANTILRLRDLGLSNYSIRTSIKGILNQRLLRRICPACKQEASLDDHPMIKELPPIKKIFEGKGCEKCGNSGYQGRVAVYEFLPMDKNVAAVMEGEVTEDALRDAAVESGFPPMFYDAWEKVSHGMTTVDEVISKVPLPA